MLSIRIAPILSILCVGLLLAACAGSVPAVAQAGAGDRPNLLVIGEDADEDTVARNNRVFDRVLWVIQDKMDEAGFNVFDEIAVSNDELAQGRVRRGVGEIVQICRTVKAPPLDVVVIFSIWPDTRRSDIATYVSARVEGRMLNCRTGQFLGSFEEKFERVALPLVCSRNCVLEKVGERARVIGRDVAHALTRRLAWLLEPAVDPEPVANSSGGGSFPTQFELVFNNFTAGDMVIVGQYLMLFGGYRSHRLIEGSALRQRIWYETSSGAAKLQINLAKMLSSAYERVPAFVSFSGNTFRVEKIVLRALGLRALSIDPHDFR